MDYKEKAQHLAETIAGLGFTTASESAARSALTEAHASGLAEGEAKRAVETNNYIAQNGEIWGALAKAESQRKEAESKLSALEKKYEALVPDRDQAEALAFCVEKKCGELRAQNAALISELFEVKVKRGQDIMEFEREKKALNAELAERDKSIIAASNAADKAEQNHKRCIAQVESLRRELSKLTAEAGRMREALMKIMTWWPTVSYARMTLLIDPVQVCREALSPSEKPAPEVKPVSQGYTACKAKDPTPRTPWLHAMGGHVCAKDKGHSGYHACCGGHCSHVWYSKKTAQDAGDGKGEGA